MTKAKTTGAKRRAKKARMGFDLAAIPPAKKRGRARMREIKTEADPRNVAMTARSRRYGIPVEEAADPAFATDMGCCIRALAEGEDRRALLEAWAAMSASRRNFRMRIIGQTGEPQGAATPMIHDAMQTDPSLTVDIRSADERDDASRKSWAAWEAQIKALPVPQMIWAIRGALDGFMGEGRLWYDGQPTATGRVAVTALRKICECH